MLKLCLSNTRVIKARLCIERRKKKTSNIYTILGKIDKEKLSIQEQMVSILFVCSAEV